MHHLGNICYRVMFERAATDVSGFPFGRDPYVAITGVRRDIEDWTPQLLRGQVWRLRRERSKVAPIRRRLEREVERSFDGVSSTV